MKYIYAFEEGNKDMKDTLGGKGACLAEMSALGLPVPPGFTLTAEACEFFLKEGKYPDGFLESFEEKLSGLERKTGKHARLPER